MCPVRRRAGSLQHVDLVDDIAGERAHLPHERAGTLEVEAVPGAGAMGAHVREQHRRTRGVTVVQAPTTLLSMVDSWSKRSWNDPSKKERPNAGS